MDIYVAIFLFTIKSFFPQSKKKHSIHKLFQFSLKFPRFSV